MGISKCWWVSWNYWPFLPYAYQAYVNIIDRWFSLPASEAAFWAKTITDWETDRETKVLYTAYTENQTRVIMTLKSLVFYMATPRVSLAHHNINEKYYCILNRKQIYWERKHIRFKYIPHHILTVVSPNHSWAYDRSACIFPWGWRNRRMDGQTNKQTDYKRVQVWRKSSNALGPQYYTFQGFHHFVKALDCLAIVHMRTSC